MDNIKYGKQSPRETDKATKVGPTIAYGIQTPASSFDRRPDSGGVSYVGPSKMEDTPSVGSPGVKQSKKHPSSGKGQ